MIDFKIEKLTVETTFTTFISGTGVIKLMDEDGQNSKNHFLPKWVVSRFKKIYKQSRFSEPVKIAVMKYDGVICALELSPQFVPDDLYETVYLNWKPDLQRNLEKLKELPEITSGEIQWKFDGKYVFTPIEKQVPADENGFFFIQRCRSFSVVNFYYEHISQDIIGNSIRHIILYKPYKNNELVALSPVISSQQTLKNFVDRTRSGSQIYNFDLGQELLYVNVDFCLDAAKKIGMIYGHDANEVLNLPELMIELNTVNLYRLDKHIRKLTPSKINLLNAMSWVMGFYHRESDIQKLMNIRGIFSNLLSNGVVNKHLINERYIMKSDLGTIPLFSRNVLNEKFKNTDILNIDHQLQK